LGRYLNPLETVSRLDKDTSLGRWRSGVQIPATPFSLPPRHPGDIGRSLLRFSEQFLIVHVCDEFKAIFNESFRERLPVLTFSITTKASNHHGKNRDANTTVFSIPESTEYSGEMVYSRKIIGKPTTLKIIGKYTRSLKDAPFSILFSFKASTPSFFDALISYTFPTFQFFQVSEVENRSYLFCIRGVESCFRLEGFSVQSKW
jgi:hypothetical protein